MAKLQTQPSEDYDRDTRYCGWREVPSVYLVCKSDGCIPVALQRQFAELAGSKVEECEAGHMVMLSMPDRVVEVIKDAIKAVA